MHLHFCTCTDKRMCVCRDAHHKLGRAMPSTGGGHASDKTEHTKHKNAQSVACLTRTTPTNTPTHHWENVYYFFDLAFM